MKSGVFEAGLDGAAFEFRNDEEAAIQPEYACVTGPTVIECHVTVDGTTVDKVWAGAGGSHSWWTAAGGRLLRYPLKTGQTLRVELSGKGAFRIDWY